MLRSFTTASALVVLVSAPLGAQPVTRPEMRAEMCGVTFVRAPDDVRYVIEQWLRAEPRCSSTIELRVVPTEGGLFLLAQRPDGRIHERLVPDAQSAGVLVASWVADDWTAPAPVPATQPAPPTTTIIVELPRAGATESVGATAPRRTRPHGKWLTIGAAVQPDSEGGGFRGEVDLRSFGGWELGGVISYTASNYGLEQGSGWNYGSMTAFDIKVMAYLSRSVTWGRWELRAGLGLGALHTLVDVEGEMSSGEYGSASTDVTTPAAELSGMLTRRLGRSLGIGLGPVLTASEQSYYYNGKIDRAAATMTIYGALRFEL